MAKVFNTTGICVPEEHYMVDIEERLRLIKELVDAGKYFTINRARQYGKTTTLMALKRFLQGDYYVVLMDFQTFDDAKFENGNIFSIVFARTFLRALEKVKPEMSKGFEEAVASLRAAADYRNQHFTLKELFEARSDICEASDKPIVLMIDEVDSASDSQVFLDFLAQIRAQYLNRFEQSVFQSVILAGVYDIKNMKQKIRPDDEHKYNSPWNIAADFNIDMSFRKSEIAEMLKEYESDYHVGMSIDDMAGWIYDYTSGYPFLVSGLCQLMDEVVSKKDGYHTKKAAWTKQGFNEAVLMILSEKNTLFESLIGKLHDYQELNTMLKTLLFTGRAFSYSADGSAIDIAAMFGFIKNQNGMVVIANRIFETRLYNYYLAEDAMQGAVLESCTRNWRESAEYGKICES